MNEGSKAAIDWMQGGTLALGFITLMFIQQTIQIGVPVLWRKVISGKNGSSTLSGNLDAISGKVDDVKAGLYDMKVQRATMIEKLDNLCERTERIEDRQTQQGDRLANIEGRLG